MPDSQKLFTYASSDLCSLDGNSMHQFAMRRALAIYPLRAVYSFIPKNACSTMRFSVAVANGLLSKEDDVAWIHQNNRTFNPDLRFAIEADYRFVILRCPYRRLASAYLSVLQTSNGPKRTLPIHRMEKMSRRIRGEAFYDRLSFEAFCEMISRVPIHQYDIHWRPQTHFLLYERYDDYFSVERFDDAAKSLAERGFEVMDTRHRLGHDTHRFEKVRGSYATVPYSEIRRMRAEGRLPDYESLYNDRIRSFVEKTYRDDLDLFDRHVPAALKLFH